MADVKWIKITTDIFSDEKIAIIETLPEADGIIVIWFKLLCLAGRQNEGGLITMSDKIAYTDEMLAAVFRRPVNIVRVALGVFEQFGMIEIDDGVITISNWEKHQNTDKLAKMREQSRVSTQKYREKQKLLKEQKQCDVTVTSRDATDKIREDKNRLEENKKESKEKKHAYGEYSHVRLTDSERNHLFEEYGEAETTAAIKYLDEYIEMTGKKYKSHYLAMRKWVFDAVKEHQAKQPARTNKWDAALKAVEELQNGSE